MVAVNFYVHRLTLDITFESAKLYGRAVG
jgi:hypothetical protein